MRYYRAARFLCLWKAVVAVTLLSGYGLPLPVGARQTNPPVVPDQNAVRWQTYTNVRFGYSLLYPASLLKPQGEADNGDGQKFLSRDGKTRLLVYGSHSVLGETIASRFAQDRRGEKNSVGRIVTYARQKKSEYVLSGRQNGQVFYRRCYLRDGDFVAFEVTYPVTERSVWDRLTARISTEFQPKTSG